MKNEEIDREALITAIETEFPDVRHYLDLLTGEVLTVVGPISADGKEMEALDEIALDNRRLAELVEAEPDRYESVPSIASEEAFRWMQEFMATIADAHLRSKLQRVVNECTDNCFRAFRQAIMHAPEPERERWFAFRTEKMTEFIDTWLEGRTQAQK